MNIRFDEAHRQIRTGDLLFFRGHSLWSWLIKLWTRSRVHVSRVSKQNMETYEATGHKRDGDWLRIGRSSQDIHITVAGGPGKHSAFIPSFGGTMVACTRIQ